jgi:hypothetical protein
LEDRSFVNWKKILKGLKEIGYEYNDRIHLAQDRNQWRALVNMVMKTSGSMKGGECPDKLRTY